jgi:hypothetical protein
LLDLQAIKKFVPTISHVDLLLPSRVLDTCKMQIGLAIESQQFLTNVIISFSISLCICSPPLTMILWLAIPAAQQSLEV